MALHRLTKGFVFNTSKQIVYDAGASSRLGKYVANSLRIPPKSSVLLVTDSGVMNARLEGPALSSLKEEGFNVTLFKDVHPNPPESNIHDSVALCRKVDAKCVIGLGGGSPMDVAKLAAFLAHQECTQKLSEIYGVEQCKGPRLPLVQIPTTAGTGSEVTPVSIISTGTNEKKGVVSPQLLPDITILDGSLTLTIPPRMTAYTGLDAMAHAIEAYTSKFKKNAISDMMTREAMRLLGTNIQKAVKNGSDLEARSEMLLGACFAGMAFANSPVGAVHALAYPIGALFHVPHGLSISLLLPHVIRFNAVEPHVADMYSELGSIAFPELNAVAPGLSRASAFADKLERLYIEFDIPKTLREVNIGEKDIDHLVEDAMKQTRLLPNNPREVGPQEAKQLFLKAL